MEWYVWWPWPTSNSVARVCPYQLRFLLQNNGKTMKWMWDPKRVRLMDMSDHGLHTLLPPDSSMNYKGSNQDRTACLYVHQITFHRWTGWILLRRSLTMTSFKKSIRFVSWNTVDFKLIWFDLKNHNSHVEE